MLKLVGREPKEFTVMSTQQLELSEHNSEFVLRCILDGRYKNANEVVEAGLRLLEAREEEDRLKLERLRAEVRIGMDDLEAGRYVEVNSVGELDAFLDEINREAQLIVMNEQNRVQATEV